MDGNFYTHPFDTDCYEENTNYEDTLALLIVLSGQIVFSSMEINTTLEAEDAAVINAYEPFRITNTAGHSHYTVLRFPPDLVRQAQELFDANDIVCCNRNCPPAAFGPVRRRLAQIYWYASNRETGGELLIQAEMSTLVFSLFREFAKPPAKENEKEASSGSRRALRCREALLYIKDHYTEKLSLGSVAAHLHISANYLSHFFRKSMGTTFSEHLTWTRLNAASQKLIHTDDTVTDIAADSGFSSLNSFYRSFRAKFGTTPLKYRDAYRADTNPSPAYTYTDTLYHAISRYYQSPSVVPAPEESAESGTVTEIACTGETNQEHNWQKIINIGYASEGLNAVVQKQLTVLQQEVGFEYLRFHGILDDEMHIYREDENGLPLLDFSYLDLLLDFLKSIHLMPYMEFSFIPGAMAKHHYRPFARPAYISDVKSIEKWQFLIREIVRHCVDRYGIDSVRKWYFSFLGFNWIQAFTQEDAMNIDEYYRLYFATFRAVKAVDPNLRFGGPATDAFLMDLKGRRSVAQWIRLSERNECIPDFFALHTYPNILEAGYAQGANEFMSREEQTFRLSTDQDFVSHAVSQAKELLKGTRLQDIPFIIDEWDSTLWQREPLNDTCYHSAYIAKTIMENCSAVSCMAQAVVSDFSAEFRAGKSDFFGGAGLFTTGGFRKGSYYVYQLFSRLGNRKIASGEGWSCFRREHTLQIVLYYYCPFTREKGYKASQETRHAPYDVFRSMPPRVFPFRLPHLPEGSYTKRQWTVGRSGGNVYDQWIRIGRPQVLSADEKAYLDAVSVPVYTTGSFIQEKGSVLSCTLSPHDVVLIELTPKNS